MTHYPSLEAWEWHRALGANPYTQEARDLAPFPPFFNRKAGGRQNGF